jgi:hypothetical protein
MPEEKKSNSNAGVWILLIIIVLSTVLGLTGYFLGWFKSSSTTNDESTSEGSSTTGGEGAATGGESTTGGNSGTQYPCMTLQGVLVKGMFKKNLSDQVCYDSKNPSSSINFSTSKLPFPKDVIDLALQSGYMVDTTKAQLGLRLTPCKLKNGVEIGNMYSISGTSPTDVCYATTYSLQSKGIQSACCTPNPAYENILQKDFTGLDLNAISGWNDYWKMGATIPKPAATTPIVTQSGLPVSTPSTFPYTKPCAYQGVVISPPWYGSDITGQCFAASDSQAAKDGTCCKQKDSYGNCIVQFGGAAYSTSDLVVDWAKQCNTSYTIPVAQAPVAPTPPPIPPRSLECPLVYTYDKDTNSCWADWSSEPQYGFQSVEAAKKACTDVGATVNWADTSGGKPHPYSCAADKKCPGAYLYDGSTSCNSRWVDKSADPYYLTGYDGMYNAKKDCEDFGVSWKGDANTYKCDAKVSFSNAVQGVFNVYPAVITTKDGQITIKDSVSSSTTMNNVSPGMFFKLSNLPTDIRVYYRQRDLGGTPDPRIMGMSLYSSGQYTRTDVWNIDFSNTSLLEIKQWLIEHGIAYTPLDYCYDIFPNGTITDNNNRAQSGLCNPPPSTQVSTAAQVAGLFGY